MVINSVWIEGETRTGKTARLVTEFSNWIANSDYNHSNLTRSKILVLAANDDTKRDLVDRLTVASSGLIPILGKTVLGFCQDEVKLYYPLLIASLNIPANFPLRLRPETEQELATRLWRTELDTEKWRFFPGDEYRFVRRILDLYQLAGSSGVEIESIALILKRGFPLPEADPIYDWVGELLITWRNWCLQQGFLTYGIIQE